MPPKGSRKAVVDPLAADANTPTDPALSTAEGKKEVFEITAAQVVDNAAGSSGLSVEEKSDSTEHLVDAVEELVDDYDDELDVDFKADELCGLRYIAILLVPFILHQELASVVSTVRLLMRRVWSSVLSADVANTSKFQILHPAYVAKTRYCRLHISFLLEGDALNVRQQDVDYQRVNGKLVRLNWLHADDPSFVRERASNPLATEVVFRNVSASVAPEALQRLLAHYKLKISQKPIYKEGLCFHRVLHPITGADTDVIKGLVVPHPNGKLRWRHAINDPSDPEKLILIHYPSLSCKLCGGQHDDKHHDAYVTERQHNIGKWNLSLGRAHRINAASLRVNPLTLPILLDPAVALISTGNLREEWLCTQTGCRKAHGTSLMDAAARIKLASHLQHLETLGTATKSTLEKASLGAIRKDYGI
ncbi:unnamed protein product [Closterium sp. Naga37s-1]|nr:unnamed protein product [Closterium sp. Naga37s-1]